VRVIPQATRRDGKTLVVFAFDNGRQTREVVPNARFPGGLDSVIAWCDSLNGKSPGSAIYCGSRKVQS
jgi:hypothetical protein